MTFWEDTLPDPKKSWKEMSDFTLIATAIWGEARGCDFWAKVAVGWVIRNRAKHPSWWGVGWRDVILKPAQFSCFNTTDPNRHKLKEPLKHDSLKAWQECCAACITVYIGAYDDLTNGADHYHSGTKRPGWAKGHEPVATVGPFTFYRLSLPEPGVV